MPPGDLIAGYETQLYDEVLPALTRCDIRIVDWSEVSASDRVALSELFAHRIQPALTPLTFDATHPFPQPSSLSLNIAAVLRNGVATPRYGMVNLPSVVPRCGRDRELHAPGREF